MSRITSFLTVSAALGALVSAHGPASAGDLDSAQQALIDTASGEVSWLARQSSQISQYDRKRATERANNCIGSLEKALAKGVPASHPMKADRNVPGATKTDAGYVAPVTTVKDFCASKGRDFQLGFIAYELGKAFESLAELAERDEFGEADVILINNDAETCRNEVDTALVFKAPGDPEISVKGGHKVKLSGARAVCDKLTAQAAQLRKDFEAAVKAELEKKLAPFRKVLKGDKMEIFERERMFDGGAYTKGGYEIESPKEFKKSRLWFVVLTFDGEDGYTWWRLRRYEFKGNKLKRQSERTGRGSEPPTKYYR